MNIFPTDHFKKSFKKLPKRIQNTAIKKDLIFRKNIYDSSLYTHKLKGRLSRFYSYRITRENIALFLKELTKIPLFTTISELIVFISRRPPALHY